MGQVITDSPEGLLALAEEAIARVRELHKPYVDEPFTKCSGCLDDDGLPNEYPCPTIKALDGEQ